MVSLQKFFMKPNSNFSLKLPEQKLMDQRVHQGNTSQYNFWSSNLPLKAHRIKSCNHLRQVCQILKFLDPFDYNEALIALISRKFCQISHCGFYTTLWKNEIHYQADFFRQINLKQAALFTKTVNFTQFFKKFVHM